MSEEFEVVHSVDDYYDGPRTGVADFGGSPHRFRCLGWASPGGPDEPWDPHEDRFELVPVGAVVAVAVARGEFRVRQPCPDLPPGVPRQLEVGWTVERTA
jgi:hypothetical protein